MSRTPETGIVLPHHEIGTDPGALRAFAQGAEAAGFTHLLIYDHVLGADPDRDGGWNGPYDKDVAFHEPFTALAFVAACTQTLLLSTAVLILPQRQTALVAKQAAELANLSSGRFRLGIGTGWNRIEYESLGVDFARRGARQEEQVAVLRHLWEEDSVDFNGEWHRIDRASILPRPVQRIPIWFGGGVDAVYERAARLGDGWIPLGRPDDRSARAIERMHELLVEQGRDPGAFGIQAQAMVAGGDAQRWQKHARAWQDLGCTHLAVRTQDAGCSDVDAHLRAAGEWRDAVMSALG